MSPANSILALSVLFLAYWITVAIYNICLHPLRAFPGPLTRAAFHLPDALSKVKGTSFSDTKALHDRYGSVVRVAPNALSYTSAQAWRDIYGFKADRTEYEKDPVFFRQGRTVNILSARQEEHNRLRKLLAPAFSEAALRDQESLLGVYFDLLISKLNEQIEGRVHGRVNIMEYYNFTTFDIIGDLVLGEPFGCLANEKYHSWIKNVFASIKTLGYNRFLVVYPAAAFLFGLLSELPALAARRKAHMAFTREKVEARLAQKRDRKDIISLILNHNLQQEHVPLSNDEIVANLRILLTAGSETTATHLTGATWLLLAHPEAFARLVSEIRSTFRKPEDMNLRSINDDQRLPYLNAVIKETFRLYPSIPAILPRITGPGGGVIDGVFVPENVSVGVHQWSAYRSRSNFALPDQFRPERWLRDEAPETFKDDATAALQPFTSGPRVCLGKSLAYFEIKSILVRILWHFDIRLDDESTNWMSEQKEYTLWDKPALWVKLRPSSAGLGARRE